MPKFLVTNEFIVSLFFSITFCFAAPLDMYINNQNEFNLTLKFLIIVLTILTLCLTLILSVILNRIKSTKLTSIVFIFGALLWLQGNVLAWKYGDGLLNGKEIIWNNYWLYGLVDTTVWVLLIILAVKKASWLFNKILFKGSLILILTQLIVIGFLYYQMPNEPIPAKNGPIEDNQFTFSSDKNVIVLVLDTFQSTIFQEIINENPDYTKELNGFTYFRNSLGGFPTTYPSIPFLLTGQQYDNSLPIQDFMKSAYTTNSLPLLLKEQGYQLDLYPLVPKTIYSSTSNLSDHGKESNYTKASFDLDELKKIENATLFRYSPHFIKKHFYHSVGEEDTIKDLIFAKNLEESKVLNNNNSTFKFYHLNGAHPPYRINQELKLTKMDYSVNSYKIQAKAVLEITKRFLRELKEIGVYDNSLIFIVGDHGAGLDFDPQVAGFQSKENFTMLSNQLLGKGMPLMLVKPINATKKFNISDASVSLSDIPKTIATELDLENGFMGRSIFLIEEDEKRERRFLYYQWEHEDWTKDYLPPMEEYIIIGNSWLKESWHQTNKVFTQQGIKNKVVNRYNLGEEIQFGQGGNAEQYQGQGWSNPESGFTWTNGEAALLKIPLNVTQSSTTLRLQAVVSPLLGKEIDSQNIIVYVNNEEVGRWVVKRSKQICDISIPISLVKEGVLEIGFKIPNAVSPAELGMNNDARKLGINFKSVIIEAERK